MMKMTFFMVACVCSVFCQTASSDAEYFSMCAKPSVDIVIVDKISYVSATYHIKEYINPRLTLALSSNITYLVENLFPIYRRADVVFFANAGVAAEKSISGVSPILGMGFVYNVSRKIHLNIEFVAPINDDIIYQENYFVRGRIGVGYAF